MLNPALRTEPLVGRWRPDLNQITDSVCLTLALNFANTCAKGHSAVQARPRVEVQRCILVLG